MLSVRISLTGTGQFGRRLAAGATVVVVVVVVVVAATVVVVASVDAEVGDDASSPDVHAVRSTRTAIAIRTVLTVVVLAAAGCGRASPDIDVAGVSAVTAASSTTTTTTATTRPPTTTTRAPRPVRIDAPGAQAIVVATDEYDDTTATLTAYTRTAAGWRVAFGPWPAFVGRKGIAPPGEKREGDGRTPSGTYGFDFVFGIDENPGTKLPYRVVTGPNIVWVEDPNSPNYNRWVDANTEDIGNQSDNMYQPPYRYGVVIAYNTVARTPGVGSGIFLHITTGKPTAGCISLPLDRVLRVLRWLDPAASPVIVISGTSA